jgi:hypothetical protein
MVTLGFGLLLTTKPSIVKFEIEGTATLTGKDEDIRKMLEIDPETKMPHILPRVYQHAFTAMYLLSTILNTPPPPQNLLGSQEQVSPMEDMTVGMETGAEESTQVTAIETEIGREEKNTPSVSGKEQTNKT